MSQKKIYVGNLSYNITQDDLSDFFSKFGDITETKLISDFETGRSKGFAFIEFETQEAAQNALEANGAELSGRNIKVSMVKENKGGKGGRGGSRSGGYNNDRHYG